MTDRLSAQDVAAGFRYTARTIRRWMRTGELRALKVGGRWLTTQAWVDEFLSRAIRPAPVVERPPLPWHFEHGRAVCDRCAVDLRSHVDSADAAKRLSVSRRQASRLIAAGALAAIKVTGAAKGHWSLCPHSLVTLCARRARG